MKKVLPVVLFVALAAPFQAMATAVPAKNPTVNKPVLVDLGLFNAGSYTLFGSGQVDLAGVGTFTMNPDGKPTTSVTAPGYAYFNQGGSFIADNTYGPAGLNAKIGSLIGTLSASPTSPADWFLIGDEKSLTLSASQHIYAAVNDTYYINNSGAFNVSVISAVPEPASYALFLTGLGMLGWMSRRKNIKA